MIKKFNSNKARLRRHQRIRRRLVGTQARPRLNVFRSGNHIYAQVIDDATGRTLAAASSLEESLRSFKTAEERPSLGERIGDAFHNVVEKTSDVIEAATEALPSRGKGAKAEKPARGGQPQKGGSSKSAQGSKTVLPAAEKRVAKTPVEALAAISNNRKVALARQVGKLVAQRAKEQGVTTVVFDRGGYAYHGRVAALAEGAREEGLTF